MLIIIFYQEKNFKITHASRANLFIILARTNPDISQKNKGLSIFLVPKTPETKKEFS